MSLLNVITRCQDRENTLWGAFSSCFLHQINEEHRNILFGLYANTYTYSMNYLQEISDEKLLQVTQTYDIKMAELDSNKQQAILDIATQRYLDSIEEQIHTGKMEIKQSEIDSDNALWDAKIEALEADRLSITTLQTRVTQAIAKANADITILETKIKEAEIDAKYVEVEIKQKELETSRTALKILEAGNKVLDLQLQIAENALTFVELNYNKAQINQEVDLIPAKLNTLTAQELDMDADVIKASTNQALVDVEISELLNRATKAALDVTDKGIDTALLDVDIANAKLDTAMVDVQIAETDAKTAKEEVRQIELQTETAMITVKLAEIQLAIEEVAAKLKSIEADIARFEAQGLKEEVIKIQKQITQVKYDNMAYEIPRILAAKLALLTDETSILQARIDATEKYQELENDEYAAKQSKQDSEHAYRMTMAALDIQFDLHKAAIKLESYEKDVIIAQEQQENQEDIDNERIKIPESNIEAAEDAADALVDVAKVMAEANITNNMLHAIGAS